MSKMTVIYGFMSLIFIAMLSIVLLLDNFDLSELDEKRRRLEVQLTYDSYVEQIVWEGYSPQMMTVIDMRNKGDTHFFPLYWWRQVPNFGDFMSAAIVDRLIKHLGYNNTRVVHFSMRAHGKKVLAVGSIVDHASNGDIIWGSGIIRDNIRVSTSHLDYRALRGRKSEEFLVSAGLLNFGQINSFGDPFILFPLLFPEIADLTYEVVYDILIIPNYIEYNHYQVLDTDVQNLRAEGIRVEVIDMKSVNDWRLIVQKAKSTKIILASSLHGLILGDVLKTPTRMLQKADSILKLFKFQDFFSVTGREFSYAITVKQALEMGPHPFFENFDYDQLIKSFPIEKILPIDQFETYVKNG